VPLLLLAPLLEEPLLDEVVVAPDDELLEEPPEELLELLLELLLEELAPACTLEADVVSDALSLPPQAARVKHSRRGTPDSLAFIVVVLS
jgi:hypothetical protein